MLCDDTDASDLVRALVYLEHTIQDARTDRAGNRRIVSKRLQFVEIDDAGQTRSAGPAPYLNYRPPTDAERDLLANADWPAWARDTFEARVQEHAALHLVPEHIEEVRGR